MITSKSELRENVNSEVDELLRSATARHLYYEAIDNKVCELNERQHLGIQTLIATAKVHGLQDEYCSVIYLGKL